MKSWITLAAVALATAGPGVKANTIADELFCQLRLYGSAENGGPQPPSSILPAPVPRELDERDFTLDERAASIVATFSGAAIRYPMAVPNSPYRWTTAGISLSSSALNQGTSLFLMYVHAVRLGADGKPEKAVQWAKIGGSAYSGAGGLTSIGWALPQGDPFDANSPFREVKLVDGIPSADLNLQEFQETSTGSGVLKVQCRNIPSLGPVPGPVFPAPGPKP